MSLNDDCLRSILNKLPCDDLCAISQTCRRLLALSTESFKCNFSSSKVLTFESSHNKEPKGEYYTEIFAEHIENVVLSKTMSSISNLTEFIDFYRQKQIKNEAAGMKKTILFPIKALTIHHWCLDVDKPYGSLLSNMLNNVESLTLSDIQIDVDLKQCLLQYMPNLKRLTISQLFDEEEEYDWIYQTYQTLESFSWHCNSNTIPVNRIKQFQQANPNTKISVLIKYEDDLQKLIDEGVNIDELFIESEYNAHELKKACERKQFNRLHLRKYCLYKREDIAELALLAPYIEGLYFRGGFIQKELAEFMLTIENLKFLQADITNNVGHISRIPKLEKLFIIMNMDKRDRNHYPRQIRRAICSQSLKKVFICGDLKPFLNFDFRSCRLNHKLKFFVKPSKVDTFRSNSSRHNYKTDGLKGEIGILRCIKKQKYKFDDSDDFNNNIEIAHLESEVNYNPLVKNFD